MLDAGSLHAALDCLSDPVILVNRSKNSIFVNLAFRTFFEIRPENTCAVKIQEHWPGFDAQLLLKTDGSVQEIRSSNGQSHRLRFFRTQISEDLVLIRVLTELSKSDALQNFHEQRLETLGMLAGGIAHDFNNILAGIIGHLTFLKTILPTKGAHSESLSAIEEGANKATLITQQILNFSKLDSSNQAEYVDFSDLLKRTSGLIRGALPSEVLLDYKIQPLSLYVLGAEAKLAQVVINLVINARDALSGRESGEIRITLEKIQDQNELCKVLNTEELPCLEYACLRVIDNGQGMSEEVKARMFEPYFSTKKKKGTGLGLASVASIVQEHGGVIEVQSVEGRGSAISVYFPAVEPRQEEQMDVESSVAGETALLTGTERILVVDDEHPVRNVLSMSLQHLGYKVETAASGLEALQIYAGSSGFDLIILDILMPQLSGEKVFFKLKEINPEVRVLVITGYASEDVLNNIIRNGGLGIIQKPFTIEELSRRVRNCFDRF